MSEPFGGLTVEDIDQIAEGIDLFIVEGFPDLVEVWQPYIDKLNALRAIVASNHLNSNDLGSERSA